MYAIRSYYVAFGRLEIRLVGRGVGVGYVIHVHAAPRDVEEARALGDEGVRGFRSCHLVDERWRARIRHVDLGEHPASGASVDIDVSARHDDVGRVEAVIRRRWEILPYLVRGVRDGDVGDRVYLQLYAENDCSLLVINVESPSAPSYNFV